jgi:hypothetical protein
MKITKISPISGKSHTRDINVKQDEMHIFLNKKEANHKSLFRNLSHEEREFVMTGVPTEEWNEAFKIPMF